MSTTNPTFQRTIVLRGERNFDEKLAGESGIYPGMLIARNSADAFVKHATKGGDTNALIAVEEPMNAGATVDTAFTNGSLAKAHRATAGQTLNLLCESGYNYTVGTPLVSNGNGLFIPAANVGTGVTVKRTFAEVTVARDLTVSGAVDSLVVADIR